MRRVRAIVAALACGLPGALAAGESCEEWIRRAEEDLRLGRLARVVDPAGPADCLASRGSKRQKARALALVAQAHLARDRVAEARQAIDRALRIDPDFAAALGDPPFFAELVDGQRRLAAAGQVRSVSGTSESLREAPATVVVITAEEIERRGYLDLEQVLHDLPGFDVSRGNGETYANIYQRGFRADFTDRMLFLVDGIEQNELREKRPYVSRQYPLVDVERIEVVYGPASTIYGANAYTGVVHVITRDPGARVPEGERFAAEVRAAAGSFASELGEFHLAGRAAGDLAWSLTARSFRSDEPDLSGLPEWDFDPSLAGVDYVHALSVGEPLAAVLFDQLQFFLDAPCEIVFDVQQCSSGQQERQASWRRRAEFFLEIVEREGEVVAIRPTPAGQAEALAIDRLVFVEDIDPELKRFADPTDDWFLHAKLAVANFTLGAMLWDRDEGTMPWLHDIFIFGANERSVRQLALYARYDRRVGENLTLTYLGRYKEHELEQRGTRFPSYGSGRRDLLDLVLRVFPRPGSFRIAADSTQVRNELTVVYEPGEKLAVVGGLDLRLSSVPVGVLFPDFPQFGIPQDLETTDLGGFAQVSLRPRPDLKLVAGARLDHNEVRGDAPVELPPGSESLFSPRGYGSVVNPRLAAVWSPGSWVVKAIYAEAFQDASTSRKFLDAGDLTDEEAQRFERPNAGLDTEKARSFELGLGWRSEERRLGIEASAFQTSYSDTVFTQFRLPVGLGRARAVVDNGGEVRIRGLQVTLDKAWDRLRLEANYTYTDPRSTEPIDAFGRPLEDASGNRIDSIRIGDIASHRMNLLASAELPHRLRVHGRLNGVGSRRTGAGTTVPRNPLSEIDAYAVVHAALDWRARPGLSLGLVVHNLFDSAYEHPGVLTADNGVYVARLPQPGRAVFLQLRARWPARSE